HLFFSSGTCENITDPMYADYYYPHIIEGTVRCVSRCFKGTQDSMNCFNGVCRISEIGPHCICNTSDVFWYLGSYCQIPVQKTALGLGLALSVLFVVSTILTIFLIRNKQKKSKKRWFDDAEVWYGQETEEEWIPSSSLTIMNKAAVSSWNGNNSFYHEGDELKDHIWGEWGFMPTTSSSFYIALDFSLEHQKQNEILKPSFSSVDTSIQVCITDCIFPTESR
ncbi:hypothetical protein E2320_002549, partial [Naja naja]